jgi:biotin carboxylase
MVSPEAAFDLVKTTGFPAIIKAAAGGGGRGIRIARSAEEFHDLMPQAQAPRQQQEASVPCKLDFPSAAMSTSLPK